MLERTVERMLITLIAQDKIYDLLLPQKVRGQYWVVDNECESTDSRRNLIGVEANDDVWKITPTRKLKLFLVDGTPITNKLTLENGKMYMAELLGIGRMYILTEPYTEDRCNFCKYIVEENAVLNIGKDETNQIVISCPYVTSKHAKLVYSDHKWSIEDSDSKNGVYVNRRRLNKSMELKPGDVIFIVGFKLIVGSNFIAINNPDNTVSIQTRKLKKYQPPQIKDIEMPDEVKTSMYYRSPLFQREVIPYRIKIEEPTARGGLEETPLILALGPSLVMGVASFSSGLFTTINTINNNGNIMNALPSMVMSVSMLSGMIVFPFIIKIRDSKRRIRTEEKRCDKYRKYLLNVLEAINKEILKQQEILLENAPAILSELQATEFYEKRLWNRIIGQRNFLTIRLGIGNIPLQAELDFPDKKFGVDEDVLYDEVNKLRDEERILQEAPVTVSFIEHRVIGMVGEGQSIQSILHNVVLQIAALHSYDEVKVILLCDECNISEYGYVRWMQHMWDNEHNKRFLATSFEEVRELNAYFMKVIEKRRAENQSIAFPHYVIISTSKGLSERCAFVSEILKDKEIEGFSYVALYDQSKNLPKECSCIVHINKGKGIVYYKNKLNENQKTFIQDMVPLDLAEKYVMKIAGYRLDLNNGKYKLPNVLTFLDMYHVGKYEHLNIASRWKENNPVVSLQAPVGINSDGDVMYLDLHEKMHGPHGLIAGMTGSGKSEFIITYILSLAVNYSPEEISFILIDYKGGGLTGAFENEKYRLPHLAGTITNLDGNSITRSLLSVQSELRRRQAIFNEARQISNEGTMDIYKYQKLYRNEVVQEPVPHLFIISDEFAELKAQQPEFMEQLISTSRIGRSLGVHLILATQKPSGVVNDQIWANSKFKVCLKVQDRADSMDMIKCADAAELVDTGRFYLQVGYNELFEIGQSAWCGAPYAPKEDEERENDETVQLIDYQGNVIEEIKPLHKVETTHENLRQIVEVTKYISQIAREEKLHAQPLWLPEIPPMILLSDIEKKYGYCENGFVLNPAIGELDDPFNQSQRILTVPLSENGNVLVYGATGSGKEMFLTTLLFSLYYHHTSKQLNTYILDFGAETLGVFMKAPQTADFIISGEDEKLTNFFSYLKKELERRKKAFAEYAGDYTTCCKSGIEEFPNIVVVINDYISFSEQYEELDEKVVPIVRECKKYGIYFVITSSAVVGIRHKIVQCFNQTFLLQLNDRMDYVTILGNTKGVYPSRHVGRGIVKEEDVYEFQVASVSEKPGNAYEFIRDFCSKLASDSNQQKAKAISVLPKWLTVQKLKHTSVTYNAVPYAMSYETLDSVDINLAQRNVVQVLAMNMQELFPFCAGVLHQLALCENSEVYVIDVAQKLVDFKNMDNWVHISKNVEETIVKLFEVTVERHNAWKRNGEKFPDDMDVHPVIVVIAGLFQLKEQLSDDGKDKLRLILEKTRGKYNLSFWVMDSYANSNRYGTEEWCSDDGIWIGNGVGEQIRLRTQSKRMYSKQKLDFGCGYIFTNGDVEQAKFVVPDEMDVEVNNG